MARVARSLTRRDGVVVELPDRPEAGPEPGVERDTAARQAGHRNALAVPVVPRCRGSPPAAVPTSRTYSATPLPALQVKVAVVPVSVLPGVGLVRAAFMLPVPLIAV